MPAVPPTPPTPAVPPLAKPSDTEIIGRQVDRWALGADKSVQKVTCTVLRPSEIHDGAYVVVYADGAEEVLSLRELQDCWDAMTSKVGCLS